MPIEEHLLWVAAIGLFVMVEKILDWGEAVGHVTGATMVAAGVALIARLW
jgi:predicted metal-binding membrane protein